MIQNPNLFELIANLNHDLRNPVCTINNLLYLLRREISNSAQLEMLEGIESANDEIQFLQSKLLDFSKCQSGCLTHYSESFAINQLVLQLISDFKSRSHAREIRLSSKIPTEPQIQWEGDKTAIQKLLQLVLSLMVSTSRYSQICIETDISHAGQAMSAEIKFRFQGSIEENQTLLKYFSQDIHDWHLASIPKTNIDLSLWLIKAFLQSLNATIQPGQLDPNHSYFLIKLAMQAALTHPFEFKSV
jgi:K+-sensing histidine kinase KdpD